MLRNSSDMVNDEPEKQLKPNLNSYRENYLRLSSYLLLLSQTVVQFLISVSSSQREKKKGGGAGGHRKKYFLIYKAAFLKMTYRSSKIHSGNIHIF